MFIAGAPSLRSARCDVIDAARAGVENVGIVTRYAAKPMVLRHGGCAGGGAPSPVTRRADACR